MSSAFKFTAKDVIAKGRISEENVETVREFLKALDIKCVPKIIPDELIVAIFIACSGDIDLTKKTIVSYFTVKEMAPCLFDNRNLVDEDMQLALRTTCFASIRWPEENTEIIYVKLRDTNYKNCYMEPQLKLSNMVVDSIYTTYPPDGIIIVQDILGIGMMHVTRLKLTSLKTFFSFIQEGLPVKLKSVHYVNSNYVLNKCISIFKMFMKPELFSMLHCHRGTEGLSDYIPARYIPSEYKGDLPSLEDHHVNVVKRLQEMQLYWDQEEALRKKCVKSEIKLI